MPVPLQRILLATEGTDFDAGAERVAIELAARFAVPLRAVLPLVTNPEFLSLAPEREEKAEAEAAAKLERLRQAARAGGVELLGKVRRGEAPFREIVDEAAESRAELIVLRRRGKRSYLANLLLGEMVHTVIGHAPCDVLIVPRAAQLWTTGILLATDGSPHSRRATAVAAAIAANRHLPLTVVSVADGGRAAAEHCVAEALAEAQAAGLRTSGRVIAGDGRKPAEAILAVGEEVGADLIVIGRRGLNRVARLLVGSTSERVAGRAGGAVLIVQETA
ncbi:MAG TPA: universal stress protein [Rhodocyclaceae bacterium]|nr:universal stress protein [Rhodocyclaceae bacterium]